MGSADGSALPDGDLWPAVLERVSRTYIEADQDRYTLERSLTISSDEMQHLYQRLAAEKAALEDRAAELQRLNEHLAKAHSDLAKAVELAVTDPLTGLTNHRGAHLRLQELVHERHDAKRPLSLILADIDGFKLFNDTYGHTYGDDILKLIAQIFREQCQPHDLACRYGGDEFLLVLPGRGRRGALAIARRILAILGRSEFRSPSGERIPVGLSLGMASMPSDATTVEKLLAAVDSAMYDAKRLEARTRRGAPAVGEARTADTTFGVLDSLVQAIDAKDHYTKRHSDVVAEYAVKLAAKLGLSETAQRALRIAGLLHDVGKLAIPDEVLKKPGPLDAEEYNVVKRHVVISEVLIRELPQLNDIIQAVSCHHERYDGSGYPRSLKGRRIPLLGRIIAIADAYSAMILDRPYRKALPLEQVSQELESGAGSQFDSDIVGMFIELLVEEMAAHRIAA